MDPIPIDRLRVAIEERDGWEIRELLNDPHVRELAMQDVNMVEQALQTEDPDVMTPFLEAGAIVPDPHRAWNVARRHRHAPMINVLLQNEVPILRENIVPTLILALEVGAEHQVLMQLTRQRGIPLDGLWRITTHPQLRPDFMRIVFYDDYRRAPPMDVLYDLIQIGDEHLPLVRDMLDALNSYIVENEDEEEIESELDHHRRELADMLRWAGVNCQSETMRVIIQAGAPLDFRGGEPLAGISDCPDAIWVILEEYEKINGNPYPDIDRYIRDSRNRNLARIFTFYKYAPPNHPPLKVGFQSYSAGAIALLRSNMFAKRNGMPFLSYDTISCVLESTRGNWFEQ